jgi:hypothetical protein
VELTTGIRFVEILQEQAARFFDMMNLGTCGKIHVHLYLDLVRRWRKVC